MNQLVYYGIASPAAAKEGEDTIDFTLEELQRVASQVPGKPLRLNHHNKKEDVGKVLSAKVIGDRLWVAVLPSDTPNGRLARTLMGEGAGKNLPKEMRLAELSMGMHWYEKPDHNGIGKKVPNSAHLQEVSLCFRGGYDGTHVKGSMPLSQFQQMGGLETVASSVPVAAAASRTYEKDWAHQHYSNVQPRWEWPNKNVGQS